MNCNSNNTSYAIMNPDPCLNSNHVGALFTGNGGNAMPGFLAHQTLSISAFQGIAVAEIKGCNNPCVAGSQAVGTAVIGSGAHLQQPHEEYFNWGYQIGGDSAVQYTLWAAYEGGFTFAGTSKSISSATISSATAAQVTVSANSGFTPGASAVIAGITNASFTQLNGTWTVASISGSTLVNLTTSGLTTESATALSAGTATPSVTIPTAPTTSVSVKGGSQGPSGNYFDIGPGSGAINNVAGINLEDVNVGSGSSCPNAWIDNVTGHTALFGTTTDCVVSFHLGSGNNPPVVTGEGQGGFQGSVFYPPGQCVGGIGQTASTVYDIPPYVKGTGNSANICTYTGVPFGPKATHACVAQNLDASLSHTPGGSDTITFTLTDSTTATATLSCGINSSGTGLGQISTTECRDTSMSHTYVVKQGDIVYPTYYPSASSDATALDPRVSWDCQ
jgi:hypothetical protein